jgi:hypothetical protein
MQNMKLKLVFAFIFLCTISLHAKEGMWLPFLLEKMNEKEMRSMGLKISAKDIYDVNAGSLKDAVVIFGSGCTGEVVSDKGLVLTNHHCGYGTVQGLSTVANNYLLNGFFAKNQQEEIPCVGLSVTFIVRIDDVTTKVKEGILSSMPDSVKNKLQIANIELIEKETKKTTGYDAQVKSFFYDNAYYLFLTEKYLDVRLVAFPPNGIGKFGGDTDNWAWPRHTGDFGMFRIYANNQNKPANFSKDNIAFTPRRSFAINIDGVKENDFTMVYGFPGRTSEYLTSSGVAEVMTTLDPARIKIREKRLSIMDADMKESEEVFIKYASKQAGIANYYKKWKGELLGLQRNNAIEKKKIEEQNFMKWARQMPERKLAYGTLLDSMNDLYKKQNESIRLNEYINEALLASEVIRKGSLFANILKGIDTLKQLDSLRLYEREFAAFQKTINLPTDKKVTQELYAIYANDIGYHPLIGFDKVNEIYEKSLLSSTNNFAKLLQLKNKNEMKNVIQYDPLYETYRYIDSLSKANFAKLKATQSLLTKYYGKYMLALNEYNLGKALYPDANSTLRVTYGKVQGVTPQDGVHYDYYTTLDGAVRKHNAAVEEFEMPQKLLDLHRKKDFGQYGINYHGGITVPLAFLASNHTTGGNSGSPVINAKGELIGTNFDRIWEGTMSDMLFDPNLCRNITLDIRYTLFVIEKFGGAKWVIDEMNLVRSKKKKSFFAMLGL